MTRFTGSVALLLLTSRLASQVPPDLARERSEFQAWLTTSEISPLRAIAQQPVSNVVRLGPADADIPLQGLPEHRVVRRGAATVLETPSGERILGRRRPVRLGTYTLHVVGSPDGPVLTVFAGNLTKKPPGFYPHRPELVFSGPLSPPRPGSSSKVRVLSPSGVVVEAVEAGTVLVPLAGTTRLRVLRLQEAGSEEAELEVFFQDQTSGQGSYPGGRFVSLIPVENGKYRLDFNRARNPFCAYSPTYPCPARWRGNSIKAPIPAGEQYRGGGLDPTGPGKATQ